MLHTRKAMARAVAAALLILPSAGHAAVADHSTTAIFSHSLNDAELADNRGTGTPDVFNLSNLTATLNNNSATGSVSGNNSIAAGALSGINGIASLIQNSGNNVVIQSSTVVNVTFDATSINLH